MPRVPARTIVPPRARQPHGLTERGRCLRGDVDDDVRERTSRVPKRRDRILVLHVDREVGAELRGRGESARVARTLSGHHDEPGAGRLRRGARREPADAGAEHRHDVTRLRLRDGHRPSDSRAERVEQRRRHGVEVRADGNEQRVGREVLVLGVAAPQARRTIDGHEAVHVGEAVPLATPVHARAARLARSARQEDLDRDAVAGAGRPSVRAAAGPTCSRTPIVSWPGTNA